MDEPTNQIIWVIFACFQTSNNFFKKPGSLSFESINFMQNMEQI